MAEDAQKQGGGPFRTVVDDPETFARNLGRMVEEAGRALAAYIEPREKGLKPPLGADLTDVVRTLARVGEWWMRDPARAVEAQGRLLAGHVGLWANMIARAGGGATAPAPDGDKDNRDRDRDKDRRFADPAWRENPFFDFLRQAYLVTSRWAEDMAHDAEGLDEHTRHKAEFYVRQLAAALSPSNFVLTNPELLRETLETSGENLVRGLHMLAEDIEAGGGELKIRQTDSTAFRVGKTLAATPGKVIFENEVCQVIQYAATTDTVLARPLLIIPPWINKFYILDLTPEKSFVKWAVGQGHTVFLVSWVNPDERHAALGFDAYLKDGILAALDVAVRAARAEAVNVIGYCVGGTLLAMALAWLAAKGDTRVASATFFTAQVDFTHAGDLKVFADEAGIAAVEKEMARKGFLPGAYLASAFNLMRSNDLIWPYIVNNYLRGREPAPFDLLYWNSDSTRLPAANHSYYLRSCYLDNRLVKGELTLDGVPVDLSRVTVPIYMLATKEDHIAPAKSVFLGAGFFGGPLRFVLADSGHIAGVVNPPARRKYRYWTGGPAAGALEDWQASAEEHPGSWWPDWQAWIEGLDPTRIKKRRIGGGAFKAIEPAPGRYVLVKA